VTGRQARPSAGAYGIRIDNLEPRALDDVALQAGCTLMDPYACCEPCWRRWVCARLMEHLRGERYWHEIDRGDFGLLRRRWHVSLELVTDVVARIAAGGDTIGILVWAVETDRALDDVVAVLRTLDVQARCLRRFPWLSEAPPCGRA
jgi:hypothetical protein